MPLDENDEKLLRPVAPGDGHGAAIGRAELKRDRLTSVLERSLNEIYMFDTDHLRFEYVNEGARRNLGYSMDEMRALTPVDLKPEFSEADFRTMVTPLLSGEQEKQVFYTVHRRKNGTVYPVEVHLQVVAHQAERVFLAVILDITDRKKAEDDLRRSEEELRALANSIPQLAWMAYADGNIFWYNDRWFEYTGTTLADMEGWGWQSVHDPEILPSVLVRWTSSIATGEPFDMEFPLRSVAGEFRWFLTRVNPVRNSEGTVVRWFGTNTDVHEVRRAREDLEQRVLDRTASLQETTQQLEAFCYTIAHDLRSPLRAQQSFAQLLLEDYQHALDAAGRGYAQRIINAAQRMDRLVDDLLAYSRLSRSELKLEHVDLNAVVTDVVAQLADDIHRQQASVSVGPLCAVHAYGPTVNLVLTNLLANAVKFTRKDVPPEIRLWSELRGTVIRLWVEDNGVGIAPEHRTKIFGVFERLHSIDQYPGTGIGLAIVQKGIERMGGRVGFESEPGRGSRFWIELPATKIDTPADTPSRPEASEI